MIYLGLPAGEKSQRIRDYCREHEVQKVFMLSPKAFEFDPGIKVHRTVDWPEIIMYRTFYPMLEEVDASSLVVVNECLRTQNRHDLTYNCIRHFLSQAGHVLVFQWLPCIEQMQDFMVLFDFVTRSKWKRERFDRDLVTENATIEITERAPSFTAVSVPTDAKTRAGYAAEKAKLFERLGQGDPHTIPRNLHLLGGKAKLCRVEAGRAYVGRNDRFKVPGMRTFKDGPYPEAPYTAFEFPHNFIDMADFLALSGQREVPALVTDLPVDGWYFDRFSAWAGRVSDGYASLR